MRAVKKNMKDQILTTDRKILHCLFCNIELSGNASDYWSVPDDHIFKCPNCQAEMELVNKIVTVRYSSGG